jgi:hypothetical protein
MTGWEQLGIGGLSQGYLSGRLSPSAVLDDALAGITAIDHDLSAFVAMDADGARRAAVRRPSAWRWLPAAPGAGEGKPTLANRKSRILRRRVATHNVRANAPVTRFRVLADSVSSPSR